MRLWIWDGKFWVSLQMDINSMPTKGNLLAAKHTLLLAKQGYDLMDKKRLILVKEKMDLTNKAIELCLELENLHKSAYKSLQTAVTQLGREHIENIGRLLEEEQGISIKSRNVMGAQLPIAELVCKKAEFPPFNISDSCEALDEAYLKFCEMKKNIVILAMIENTAFRLEINIKKTTKRANALENITIPKYEGRIKSIQSTLEERARDEFIRTKMVKEAGR